MFSGLYVEVFSFRPSKMNIGLDLDSTGENAQFKRIFFNDAKVK